MANPPLDGQSTSQAVAGVSGENTAGGPGVRGQGSPGVWGESQLWEGVHGIGHGLGAGVAGFNEGPQGAAAAGVWGESQLWEGVHGVGHGRGAGVAGFNEGTQGAAAPGVWGESQLWEGVHGIGHGQGAGVAGFNEGPQGAAAPGVWGESKNSEGVHGETSSEIRAAGVVGVALNPRGIGPGVLGQSQGSGEGVLGTAVRGTGVTGVHGDPALQETTVANDASRAGVFGASQDGAGVLGYSRDNRSPAVYAFGGLKAIALGKPLAALFEGDVEVNGDLKVDGDIHLPGADCAERFVVANAKQTEAGTVVVIDGNGHLRQSEAPYDRKVAGVVSGAGQYRPGIVLDAGDAGDRLPVALVGKVYCKVDAQYSPIDVGDLLTTSPTPGHAMRAADPLKAFGAIIGKALSPRHNGTGLIPILVALS
jgi:hypothetical protein